MVIKATYYGANGWLVDLDETRILIDPWLKGDLTFPPGDWLIKGALNREMEVPIDIDFLLSNKRFYFFFLRFFLFFRGATLF